MKNCKMLSVCIIAYNDALFIERSILNAKMFADDLFIVDIGSTDQTKTIARRLGIPVLSYEWKADFSELKNYCMEKATGDWILFLQAYEMLNEEMIPNIHEMLLNPNVEGYLLPICFNLEEYLVHSPEMNLRLIRNRPEYRFIYQSYERMAQGRLVGMEEGNIQIVNLCTEELPWDIRLRENLLEQEAAEKKEDSYLKYMRGIHYLNKNMLEKSVLYLNRAYLSACMNDLYVPHLYKCLALTNIMLENMENAKKIIEEGMHFFPFYTDLHILHAEILKEEKLYEHALEDLKVCEGARERPYYLVPGPELSVDVIYEEIADVYFKMCDYKKALQYYVKSYQVVPSAELFCIVQDLMFVTNTESTLAMKHEDEVEWDACDIPYLIHQAICGIRDRDIQKICMGYECGIEEEEKEFFTHQVLQMLIARGEIELTERFLERINRKLTKQEVRRLHRNNVKRCLLAVTCKLEEVEKGEKHPKKKTIRKKNGHYLAGCYFKKNGKEKAAYLAFLHALEVEPDAKEIWIELLECWSKEEACVGQWEEVFGGREGKNFEDSQEFFHYVYGLKAFYEGRFTEAREEFLQIAGKTPVFEAYLTCAAAFEGKNDPQDLQVTSAKVGEEIEMMRDVIVEE